VFLELHNVLHFDVFGSTDKLLVQQVVVVEPAMGVVK
jgi:hypothetical protein